MTDCSNAEMRDLLPDLLHESLSVSEAALVEQHVASCADCASELALLRVALRARPVIAVDVRAIVAALPKRNDLAELGVASADVVARRPVVVDAPSAVPTSAVSTSAGSNGDVRSIESAPSMRRQGAAHPGRRFDIRRWRAAAAITPVALGGLSVVIARRGLVGITDLPAVSDSVGVATNAGVAEATTSGTSGSGSAKPPALSVGELSDYSDDEIESVIQRLDKWDGAAAAEPLPGVPLLPTGAGGF